MFSVKTKEVYKEVDDYFGRTKEYRKKYKVRNVRDDGNGYPQFLILEDGQWKYKSAKYFVPVEDNNYEENN